MATRTARKANPSFLDSLPPFIKTPWFLGGIVLLIISQIIIFRASDPNAGHTPAPVSTAPPTTPAAAAIAASSKDAKRHSLLDQKAVTGPTPDAGSTPAVTEIWEQKIDSVLDKDIPDEQAVSELMALYPSMPDDGKVMIVEHVVDMVEDKDYAIVKPILLDPKAPEDARQAIFDDLYGRSENVELPLMVDILKTPNHPNAEEARETLKDYLENDYGTDNTAWDGAVKKWLNENADPSE